MNWNLGVSRRAGWKLFSPWQRLKLHFLVRWLFGWIVLSVRNKGQRMPAWKAGGGLRFSAVTTMGCSITWTRTFFTTIENLKLDPFPDLCRPLIKLHCFVTYYNTNRLCSRYPLRLLTVRDLPWKKIYFDSQSLIKAVHISLEKVIEVVQNANLPECMKQKNVRSSKKNREWTMKRSSGGLLLLRQKIGLGNYACLI